MNEMYEMSIVTHYYSVIGVILVIFINMGLLYSAKDIKVYQRQMSLFTPIASTAIAGVIFTGIVMIAAKHLDFTIENIIMIVFAISIIWLEVKRVKKLKYLKTDLDTYKKYARFLLVHELLLTISISLWMLI